MISAQEYQARRERLLSATPLNSVIIVSAANEVTRSRDTEYHFRQNSDFFYLSGFTEPDAFLVLFNRQASASKNSADNHSSSENIKSSQFPIRSAIFVREKDPQAETWHGRRLGVDAAPEKLSIDMAYGLSDINELLPELIDGAAALYYSLGDNQRSDKIVQAAIAVCKYAPKQSKIAPSSIVDVSELIHKMRLIKSPAELELMQASANIACEAHKRAMQTCRPGAYEYQLEAHILHTFAMHGARFAAYNTIVGGGENACILHYTENHDELVDGDLVLIDAGAEYAGYASDITRTFPVNGRFSEPQKALYTIVLNAQLASIASLKPGATLSQAMQVAAEIITQGLLDLGILQGSFESCMQEGTYKAFFMHGLGHYLGLDVHDVGPYKEGGNDILLAPGMVLTVEPGIYIATQNTANYVPNEYKNIGIRIEDNVVITNDGCRVLTTKAPKTIDEIETFMANADE